jgi:type IV secretion system protein TrbE
MLAQFRRVPNAQVFWFDKGLSSYALTKAVVGTHWNLGDDDLAAAPLIGIDQPREFEWAQGFCERLLVLNGIQLVPAQQTLLADAMRQLAHHPTALRTLSALRTAVQDTTIRDGLAPYTLPDARAKYLDAKTDIDLDASWITFEMENLVGLSELTTLPMLFYLSSMGDWAGFFHHGML